MFRLLRARRVALQAFLDAAKSGARGSECEGLKYTSATSTTRRTPRGPMVSPPPPPARNDVDLDRTAAYLETAATPADAEGFRAAADLALACLDAVAQP